MAWNPATHPYRCAYFPRRGGYYAPCARSFTFQTEQEARAKAAECPKGWTASLHVARFSRSWGADGQWESVK